MFKVSIPKISDEELKQRYEKIKPVVCVKGQLYYFREFTFEEICEKEFLSNSKKNLGKKVGKDELEVIKGLEFVCLHNYIRYTLFSPTISEILSQIHKRFLPSVIAFEVIKNPRENEVLYDDFYRENLSLSAHDSGYQLLTVRLYGKKW